MLFAVAPHYFTRLLHPAVLDGKVRASVRVRVNLAAEADEHPQELQNCSKLAASARVKCFSVNLRQHSSRMRMALLLCHVLRFLAMARAAPLRFPRTLLQHAVKGSSARGCTHMSEKFTAN